MDKQASAGDRGCLLHSFRKKAAFREEAAFVRKQLSQESTLPLAKAARKGGQFRVTRLQNCVPA
jgi:hypothetical protein